MSTPSTRSRRVVGVVIDGDVLRGVELRRGMRRLRARAAMARGSSWSWMPSSTRST